jgi:hypothetical protein
MESLGDDGSGGEDVGEGVVESSVTSVTDSLPNFTDCPDRCFDLAVRKVGILRVRKNEASA